MAIIKTDTKEAILTAVNRYLRGNGASMDVYQICRGRNRIVQVGVNWAACGTKLPDEAKRFAEYLQEAANICEVINAYEWTEKWGSDYNTEEEYYKDVTFILEGLEGGNDIKKLIDLIV